MSGFVSINHVKFDSLRPLIAKAAERNQGLYRDFSFNDGSFGSGNLCEYRRVCGHFNCSSCCRTLSRFSDFVLVVANYPHRLEATAKTVEHVAIGSPPGDGSLEPVQICPSWSSENPTSVEAIQSEKLFYNMDFAHSGPAISANNSQDVGSRWNFLRLV